MEDEHKTKAQLIEELDELRQKVGELEGIENVRRQAEEELRIHRDHLEDIVESRWYRP